MSRVRLWFVLSAGCAILASSLSVNRARRAGLVDEYGNPIRGAFVVYHYSAGTKLIWPWAYYEGPFLARTDPRGQFAIPRKVRLRFPLVNLTSPVRAYVNAYVPRLHNSCEINLAPAEAESYCAKPAGQAGEVTSKLHDLSAQPATRFRTLWLLIYSSRALPLANSTERRDLITATRIEYDQFLAEFGSDIFENSPNQWPHFPVSDWTPESGQRRPWRFFLKQVPFYGATMDEKLAQIESQVN